MKRVTDTSTEIENEISKLTERQPSQRTTVFTLQRDKDADGQTEGEIETYWSPAMFLMT